MRILGIDPGFGRMGFGLIEGTRDNWQAVTYGCIETDGQTAFIDRLNIIYQELKKIVKKYAPQLAAVEELFFYTNVKTAIQVSQARGAILLTLCQARLPVYEYTPLEVKQTLTGYGRAEKKQVQTMVRLSLSLGKKKLQDDAADALAVALTAGYICG